MQDSGDGSPAGVAGSALAYIGRAAEGGAQRITSAMRDIIGSASGAASGNGLGSDTASGKPQLPPPASMALAEEARAAAAAAAVGATVQLAPRPTLPSSPASTPPPPTSPALPAQHTAIAHAADPATALSEQYVIPTAQHAAAEAAELKHGAMQQRQSPAAAAPALQRRPQQTVSVRKAELGGGLTLGVVTAGLEAAAAVQQHLPRRTPSPPPRPSMECSLAPTGATPPYHLVVLASPRAQHARYLATTLVSIAAADARPASVTVLWAAHRRKPPPPSPPPPPPPPLTPAPTAPAGASAGTGTRGNGTAGAAANADGLEVTLVQRVEMPPPKPQPKAAAAPAAPAAAAAAAVAKEDLNTFSLLENLAMYSEDRHPTSKGRRQQEGEQQGLAGYVGAAGTFPHLRVRFLPESVRQGDILGSYYQALDVPDQVAAEAGIPELRKLPLIVLEADVLIAPRFAARLACALHMVKSLGGADTAGNPDGTPDYAMSLYDPGMIPQDVPDVMRVYDKSKPPAEPTDGSSTRMSLVPSLWSWGSQGLLYSYGIRVSLMRHYREVMAGCAPQDGLQDIELVRHMQGRGCAGIPPLPPVTAQPKVTGPACDPRVVHGNATYGGKASELPAGSGRCYLFTTRPAMVQHVGASSALFGAVSKRFHVTLNFPERVSIPGFDKGDTW